MRISRFTAHRPHDNPKTGSSILSDWLNAQDMGAHD